MEAKEKDTAPKVEFKGIASFMKRFPDERACMDYFEGIRWEDGKPVCPHCECDRVMRFSDGKTYKCSGCRKKFSLKFGTVFADSNITFHQWFLSIYLLCNFKKGISSHELARQVGITQKASWFVLHRVREILTDEFVTIFKGVVEVDETFVGGKEKNKHWDKRTEGTQGRSTKVKTGVIGLKERSTNQVQTLTVPDFTNENVHDAVTQRVAKGAILMSDEFGGYTRIADNYDHRFITHGAKQYAGGIDNDVHCNGMENYWSIAKRTIYGINHWISKKHTDRYLKQFDFRHNTMKMNESSRFSVVLGKSGGKRLKYADLIGKKAV